MKKGGKLVALLLLTLLFSFLNFSNVKALTSSSVVSFSDSNLLTDNQINSNIPIIYGDNWTANFTNSTDCRIVIADSIRSFIVEPGKTLSFPIKNNVLVQTTLNVSSMPHFGSCANEVYRSSVSVYPGTLVTDLTCVTGAHNFDIRFTYAGLIPKTSYFYSPSDSKAQYYVGNDNANGSADVTIPDVGQDQIYSLFNANQKGNSIKIGSTTCKSSQTASNNSKNTTSLVNKSNSRLIFILIGGSFLLLIIIAIESISLWVIFEKAKQRGVYSIIPVLNLWTLFKLVDMSPWWGAAIIVPGIDLLAIFAFIISLYKLGRKFSKSRFFSLLTALFPYVLLPVIAFSEAKYNKDSEE